MADLSGGQLIIDGESGPFAIVRDAWWPKEEALTPLWFPADVEGDLTQVGLGDYVVNPLGWSPTRVQIPMWFRGDIDGNGDEYANATQGFRSNLNFWHQEILGLTAVRTATLIDPDGVDESTATITRLALVGNGRRRPSGWPLMFEFTLPHGPFVGDGGS